MCVYFLNIVVVFRTLNSIVKGILECESPRPTFTDYKLKYYYAGR